MTTMCLAFGMRTNVSMEECKNFGASVESSSQFKLYYLRINFIAVRIVVGSTALIIRSFIDQLEFVVPRVVFGFAVQSTRTNVRYICIEHVLRHIS